MNENNVIYEEIGDSLSEEGHAVLKRRKFNIG